MDPGGPDAYFAGPFVRRWWLVEDYDSGVAARAAAAEILAKEDPGQRELF